MTFCARARRLGYQPGLEEAKPNKFADVLQLTGNR